MQFCFCNSDSLDDWLEAFHGFHPFPKDGIPMCTVVATSKSITARKIIYVVKHLKQEQPFGRFRNL
ncbi:MAG: hypothetical protein C0397_01530 [Odoribacter sp.]|nr:hypothetical protein [Odoribacter sp.]